MEIIYTLLSKIGSGIGPFFLLLGLLIFVHELGHYLVAVYFGVRVETFSLGFGKKIFSFKRGETTYCLSLIPLGGYVKMYGDDPTAEIPEEQKKYSFLHKPVWPRIAIVLAGPIMNLLFAILVFSIIGLLGEPVPGNQVGDINPSSKAYAVGFRSGDTILDINQKPMNQWDEIKQLVESHAGKSLVFKVKREGSSVEEQFSTKPTLEKNPFIFTTQREVGTIDGLSSFSTASVIGVIDSKTLAANLGLKTFDMIESIDGKEVFYWRQLDPVLTETVRQNKSFIIKFNRVDSLDEKKTKPMEITIAAGVLNGDSSVLTQLGLIQSDLYLRNVRPGTPAQKAGLKSGDYVTEIDGQSILTWQSVLDRVKSYKDGDAPIRFTIRRDTETLNFPIVPERVELPTDQGGMEKRYAIGVEPAIYTIANNTFLSRVTNPFSALAYGTKQSWEWTKLISISFVRLIQNEVSAKNISGIITIGRVASKSFEVGMVAFLKMMAIISINLFILNLLPVPVLDGGHLVFFTIEALKGAPISFKKLEVAQQVGLVLLLSLMIFALYNDITHLISSW